MDKSMMLKCVDWRDGGTVFVTLVKLSCCKIYDEYKGVSKARRKILYYLHDLLIHINYMRSGVLNCTLLVTTQGVRTSS